MLTGRNIEISDKRPWDFSQLPTGLSKEVVIVKAAPVVAFRDAVLQVRIHSQDIGSGSLEVLLWSTAPTRNDPSLDFVDPTPVGTVTLLPGTTTALLRETRVRPTFGRAVRLTLRPTQGAGGTNLKATLSARLVVRT